MSASSSQPFPPMNFACNGSDLQVAAGKGDLRKVRQQIAAGADVNMVATRLDPGVPVSADTFDFSRIFSPLELACDGGHTEVVKVLLEAGADVLRHFSGGETALSSVIKSDNCEMVQLLLNAKPEIVDIPDSKGYVPLLIAAGKGRDRIVELMLSSGAEVDRAGEKGNTALIVTSMFGYVNCVRSLLRAGADTSKVDEIGLEALHYAVQGGFVDVVEVLVNGGATADINNQRKFMNMPILVYAVHVAQFEVVKCLLRNGADPFMAFHHAKDLAIFNALLAGHESQAAAYRDKKENTFLHYAVKKEPCGGFLCALIKAGLDPTVKNKRGATAADIARKLGQPETAKLLDLFEAKHRQKMNAASTGLMQAEAVEGDEVEESTPSSDSDEKMKASVDVSQNEDVKESVDANKDTEVEQTSIKNSDSSENFNVSVEVSQGAKAQEEPVRILQPCLHCEKPTHRRCARCRTAYICSRDCQLATIAEHKPTCMEIYEERQSKEAKETGI